MSIDSVLAESTNKYPKDLQKQCKQWCEHIADHNHDQYSAINSYTGSSCATIANVIRGFLYGFGDLDSLSFNFCLGVESAPVYNGTLFRGVKNKRHLAYHVGDSIVWSQFTSTSCAVSVAYGFAHDSGSQGIIFAIKNASGFCIEFASSFGVSKIGESCGERESILPPSQLRIVEIGEYSGDSSIMLIVCEIERTIPIIKGSLVC